MRYIIVQIPFALMVIVFLAGCHDHEDFIAEPHGVNIQFDSTRLEVRESELQKTITITFDQPASQTGTLSLLLNDAAPSRFIVEPNLVDGRIDLNVIKGQESAIVTFRPINNHLDDGDLIVDISIFKAPSGFTVGMRKSVSVKLLDDDSPASEPRVIANFNQPMSLVSETGQKQLAIRLSGVLETVGSIELAMYSDKAIYGVHYTTTPEAVHGKINLSPALGADEVNLLLTPINNDIITGDTEITFSIHTTSGSIGMGNALHQSVIITDDELVNKPRGFETQGGQWSLKKTYEYDQEGRVKVVHVEKSTPVTSNDTQTYYYDLSGRIQKINSYPGIDVVYTWSADRIVKSETIDHDVLKQYIQYDYDAQGNVSGTAHYFRQPNGEFKLGFLNVYLYYEDHNLYQSQTYLPTAGTEEFTRISTRTYEGYLDAVNPFPMVEILPGITAQTRLPSTYILEENGVKLIYQFSYEFRNDNLVTRRIASSGGTMEISNYLYY
jgi:hypothetical protein